MHQNHSYGPPPYPVSPPPSLNGWGREVEHRLTKVEIFKEGSAERATKHGREIDSLREEMAKIRSYGLKLMTYALLLAGAALGHLTKDPTIGAVVGLIKGLKAALP